jgi:hypothetical protein
MTFLSPWFLLGMLFAVVPVLIHLWYQRRLKRIPFSTLRFLRRSEAVRFGWLRLREWLILALRCLFIILLFLALARPQAKSELFRTGRLASVCLIIDNSYSMYYGDNFEKMKDLMQQVIARYSPRSEFCLIALCGDKDEDSFWMTRASALAALKNIRLTYTKGSINAAMARVPVGAPKYGLEYIYVGDGQSYNFKDFPLSKIEGLSFYWVRIPTGSNVGLINVALRDPVAIALDEYELRATIKNYSARVWTGKIGVTSGDYYVEKELAVIPGDEHELDIALSAALLTGKVEIFDDSLSIDNIYYFSKSLLRSINILLVGDNSYITNAFTSGNDSGIRFSVDNTAQVGGLDLRKYQVVILNKVQEISEAERIRLMNHLNMPGTALIMILGDDVGENARRLFPDPCRFEGEVLPRGYVTVDWIDREHPVFTIFGPGRPLSDVQYFRYAKVITKQGILARFSSGDPFIIMKDNTCVLTGGLDAQSTNFVFKNSFVPFLLRMLIDLVSDQYRKEYHVGDQFLEYGYIRAPNGEFLHSGDKYFMPGFHVVDQETLCVNVDPSEGDLRVLGRERADILGLREIDSERALTGSDLTDLFLIIAFILLAFELGLLILR